MDNLFEYGGYLPLELNSKYSELYQNDGEWKTVGLNTGRASFYFAAKSKKINKVFIPYFTCEEVENPFKDLGLEIEKYYLDTNLLPKNVSLQKNDLLLWTNYFGNARAGEIDEVCKTYHNVIIDNCHAFFSPPRKNVFNCYSARKFFGVSDGSYLVSTLPLEVDTDEREQSFLHFSHLTKQIELGVNEGYPESLRNEKRVGKNYRLMSNLSKRILTSIDYQEVKIKRFNNLSTMHAYLGEINSLEVNLDTKTQMYYPLKVKNKNLRQSLIDSGVYTPFWWRHILDLVPSNSLEFELASDIVYLPIDQRYDDFDMKLIGDLVHKLLKK
jgi:hypothetical protein